VVGVLSVIRRWFGRLPPGERDMPLVVLDGRFFSPRDVLREVEAGTQLGARLRAKVDAGTLGTTEAELEQLPVERLRNVLSRYPPWKPVVVPISEGRAYTAADLLREVEARTPLGMRLIRAEIRHARWLLGLR